MIVKEEVIEYFDASAAEWDARQQRNDAVVAKILDLGGICAGIDVLDVACGTGFLFADYLARGVRSVTAVDISPEMVCLAKAKCEGRPISVCCADAAEWTTDQRFDAVMIYNAFPHFLDPEKLLRNLCSLTRQGGRITVAHGLSRRMIDSVHVSLNRHISDGLISEQELAALFRRCIASEPDVVLSDDEMYAVSGLVPAD